MSEEYLLNSSGCEMWDLLQEIIKKTEDRADHVTHAEIRALAEQGIEQLKESAL
jgi:hypothetical protein